MVLIVSNARLEPITVAFSAPETKMVFSIKWFCLCYIKFNGADTMTKTKRHQITGLQKKR